MQPYAYNQVNFQYGSLAEAFPEVDPNMEPLGERILVQLRRAMTKTKGGIILTEEIKETEKWNEQVAKVIKLGRLAFHNRNTMVPWPEGAWFEVGDYVRVPKHGGDRFSVSYGADGDTEEIIFACFKDLDVLGKVKDPLNMKAFI